MASDYIRTSDTSHYLKSIESLPHSSHSELISSDIHDAACAAEDRVSLEDMKNNSNVSSAIANLIALTRTSLSEPDTRMNTPKKSNLRTNNSLPRQYMRVSLSVNDTSDTKPDVSYKNQDWPNVRDRPQLSEIAASVASLRVLASTLIDSLNKISNEIEYLCDLEYSNEENAVSDYYNNTDLNVKNKWYSLNLNPILLAPNSDIHTPNVSDVPVFYNNSISQDTNMGYFNKVSVQDNSTNNDLISSVKESSTPNIGYYQDDKVYNSSILKCLSENTDVQHHKESVSSNSSYIHIDTHSSPEPRTPKNNDFKLPSTPFGIQRSTSYNRRTDISDKDTKSEPSVISKEIPEDWDEHTTTVMLRNVPNRYTQKDLRDILDENGFELAYNFLYLPMDFTNCCNVGYGFINLLSAELAREFFKKFNGLRLTKYKSRKICFVSKGRVQGYERNIQHFKKSPILAIANEEQKPVILKDGKQIPFPQFINRKEKSQWEKIQTN